MPRQTLVLLGFLLVLGTAAAQQPDDEYYPYATEQEEQPATLLTDSALFYRAVQSAPDLYGRITDFNLPDAALKRRGQDRWTERLTVGEMPVSYRYSAALRLLGAEREQRPGLSSAPEAAGLTGGVTNFRFPESMPLEPYLVSANLSGRNYLAGAKFAAVKAFRHGWNASFALDARTGRDLYVEGVYTNALTASLRVAKQFGEGHELSLLFIAPTSVRGTRLSAAHETFLLTGNNYYNPAWGFQDGKVRNSRVRRETVPLTVLAYHLPLSKSTSLAACASAETSVRKYSMLGWYDASTPMPDNYRYLPGYTGDRETELAWRNNDTRYTQIDWDELIRRNRMAGGEAVYALEDRAERLTNLDFRAMLTTEAEPRLTLRYGVVYSRRNSRFYKQMRDLLGAHSLTDIDQFLVDDESYGNLLQNDLRNPGRTIGQGDRFGYDYALTTRMLEARLRAEYRSDRFRGDLDLSLGDAAVFRRGYYEKELFPGEQSFGRSRRMRFTPYTFKAAAGWAFSPRHYLDVALLAAATVPEAENLFLQPLYNNRTADNPVTEKLYAAEANYRVTGAAFDLQLTAYLTASFDGQETRRYYDDLAGVFCDLALTNLSQIAYGVEAAAEIRLSYRWRLSLAASAGRFKYLRNPQVNLFSDVDNTAVDLRAESFMGGCETGGAPQFTALLGINYYGPKGWGVRASAGYAGGRFVEPAAVRRTERIARQAGITPEAFDAFTHQERLGDAFTLDASLFKSFYFDRSRLTFALMLRNLTGAETLYNGYESLRVERLTSGDQTFRRPQATRYTYSYPRSFYLTVSYKF